MNCDEARKHWDLYFDSEGDAECHFHVNQHLAGCPACARWFEQQSQLERAISARLQDAPAPEVDWSAIVAAAGVRRRSGRLSPRWAVWRILGATALAAGLLWCVIWFGWAGRASGPPADLWQLSAETHRALVEGRVALEFRSESDLEVDGFLSRRAPFPVRCPPRRDSGFAVRGAGLCRLADQTAAVVAGMVDAIPVSVFVLPRESLAQFPRQHSALKRHSEHTGQAGGRTMVLSVIDQNLVLVVGEAESPQLLRVLRSYGTYPHPS